MNWTQLLAQALKSSHSDTVSVVRAGKKAKLRTRRRERHTVRTELHRVEERR